MKWRIIILDCENGFMMPFEMLGGALMDFLKDIGLWYAQGAYRRNGKINEYIYKVSVEKFTAIENKLL